MVFKPFIFNFKALHDKTAGSNIRVFQNYVATQLYNIFISINWEFEARYRSYLAIFPGDLFSNFNHK